MSTVKFALVPLAALSLAACQSQAEQEAERAEDAIETQANQSAAAAGAAVAALGLTEAQLLEADLVAADGTDLGDVEQIRRNAAGAVEGFLVEVENTDPDRYVMVPLAGLTTRADGKDTDLQANMTAADLARSPAEQLVPPIATPVN